MQVVGLLPNDVKAVFGRKNTLASYSTGFYYHQSSVHYLYTCIDPIKLPNTVWTSFLGSNPDSDGCLGVNINSTYVEEN